MVDFRSSGYSNTSGSGLGSYSSGSSSGSRSRTATRSAILARPGVGQAVPGMLSGLSGDAPVGTYYSGEPSPSGMSQASPYPWVTQGGQSGQLIPQTPPVTTDFFGMTDAFAAKADLAQQEEMQRQIQEAMTQWSMFNQQQNVQPNILGQAPLNPNPFATMQSMPAQPNQPNASMMQQPTQQAQNDKGLLGELGLYDTVVNLWKNATTLEINGTKKSVFEVMPTTGSIGMIGGTASTLPKGVSALFKITSPGVIEEVGESAVAAGNAMKNAQTFGSWAKNFFTLNKITNYINPATGQVVRQTVQRNPWTIAAVAGAAVTGAWIGYSLYKSGKEGQAVGTRDVKEELGGLGSMAYRDLSIAGDKEAADAVYAVAKNAMNDSVNFSMVPGKSGMEGTQKYVDGANQILDIMKMHYDLEYETQQELSNMSPAVGEMAEKASFNMQYQINKQKMIEESKKRQVDYFNEQQAIAQANLLIAQRQHDEQSAAFWLNYKKKILAMEKKAMEEQAAFWLEYNKQIAKLKEMQQEDMWNSGRSSLGFGLF